MQRARAIWRDKCCYLSFFSLPEVKWLLTNPKEVPLNMKDTPTAPLFPEEGKKEKKQNVSQAGWSRGQRLTLLTKSKGSRLRRERTDRSQGAGYTSDGQMVPAS